MALMSPPVGRAKPFTLTPRPLSRRLLDDVAWLSLLLATVLPDNGVAFVDKGYPEC